MAILAFDTSNYTTSVAYIEGNQGFSSKKLLQVPSGTLGLRQQEALFQHGKALPLLLEDLLLQVKAYNGKEDFSHITGISVSTKPRETEDSYMPCFLAGENMAKSLGIVLRVPCFTCSHQQGHLAAALWSLDQMNRLDKPFLAWHISGGTTELLLVEPDQHLITGKLIGGTTDISAGQLIDRTGLLLGLDFPSGRAVDQLALSCDESGVKKQKPFSVKANHLQFSLSGMENKVKRFFEEGESPPVIAAFVLETIATVLDNVTQEAQKTYGENLPVVFCGGVASSLQMQKILVQGLFPPPVYATDNAMGVAVLGQRLSQGTQKT